MLLKTNGCVGQVNVIGSQKNTFRLHGTKPMAFVSKWRERETGERQRRIKLRTVLCFCIILRNIFRRILHNVWLSVYVRVCECVCHHLPRRFVWNQIYIVDRRRIVLNYLCIYNMGHGRGALRNGNDRKQRELFARLLTYSIISVLRPCVRSWSILCCVRVSYIPDQHALCTYILKTHYFRCTQHSIISIRERILGV